jgi:hypothetical protein
MGTLQQLALRHNALATDRLVAKLTELSKRTRLSKPAIVRYQEIVRARLDKLAPRVEEAKSLLQELSEKRQSPDSDKLELHAEAVPTEVVVFMFTTLERLYDKSVANGDSYTIGCVGEAADLIRSALDDKLLKPGDFTGDEGAREREAERKVMSGLTLYRRILRALDNTQDELNVAVPPFPGKPTIQ